MENSQRAIARVETRAISDDKGKKEKKRTQRQHIHDAKEAKEIGVTVITLESLWNARPTLL